MRILFLAPHPFYQDRGTPIAVNLMLQALSERGEEVDVLTYHEGRNVSYENVNIFRIPNLFFVKDVRPGFSGKKLICDIFMFLQTFSMLFKRRYDIVHAVEESVFMALTVKKIFRIPYIYDMDSSMAQQMVEKFSYLALFSRIFAHAEKIAVKQSYAVVPVCDALAKTVREYDPNKKIVVLHDIPLLDESRNNHCLNFKKEFSIQGLTLLYIGNLEIYQGIDLLLESFQKVLEKRHSVDLLIVGGMNADIKKYQNKCRHLRIASRVHFAGQKPIDQLAGYLRQADILVSPRIRGENTPMKIYSYLKSAKAILATDIYSHTQVLNNRVAALANPNTEEFTIAMIRLIENSELRTQLGEAGKKLVQDKYSYSAFKNTLNRLYNSVNGLSEVKHKRIQFRRKG